MWSWQETWPLQTQPTVSLKSNDSAMTAEFEAFLSLKGSPEHKFHEPSTGTAGMGNKWKQLLPAMYILLTKNCSEPISQNLKSPGWNVARRLQTSNCRSGTKVSWEQQMVFQQILSKRIEKVYVISPYIVSNTAEIRAYFEWCRNGTPHTLRPVHKTGCWFSQSASNRLRLTCSQVREMMVSNKVEL